MSNQSNSISSFLTLTEVNSKSGKLTLDDLKTISEQALRMLEESYVHLPLKIAMYGIDPCQRLRILSRRLDQVDKLTEGQEFNFHKEMLSIFTSLRDLHTIYMLPEPFSDHFTILPFLIESYIENDRRKFLVTQAGIPEFLKSLFPSNFDPKLPNTFKRGVEITHWNGVPIERAIEINSERSSGNNPEARFVRGLQSMTIRPLKVLLPPDEQWVIIGYKTLEGIETEFRQEWIASSMQTASKEEDDGDSINSGNKYKLGVDITTDLITEMKETLFAPESVRQSDQLIAELKSIDEFIANAKGITSNFPRVLEAKKISEDFGYVRIYTFLPRHPVTPTHIFEEFSRLLLELPKKGLIIDVRANGGGYIDLAESLLQLLTPHEIIPEPYQFLSSPLILEMARKSNDPDIKAWEPLLTESVTTGSTFSRGSPITNATRANLIGQLYHGPVVLITDALCYSATDLFAAGFKDHQIGIVLGTNSNTGAGGANVWNYDNLRKNLIGTRYELKQLPSTSSMNVSIRRNVRVKQNAGTPVEDIGISPDVEHKLSRRDLLEKNIDLIQKAVEILSSMPIRQFDIQLNRQDTVLQIEINSLGIDRCDIYMNDRPIHSQNLIDGINPLTIEKMGSSPASFKIIGTFENNVVVARKINI